MSASLRPPETQSADFASRAGTYASGAANALNLANSERGHDAARTQLALDEAVAGLREALANAVAARAAFAEMGRASLGLALIAVPIALLFVPGLPS